MSRISQIFKRGGKDIQTQSTEERRRVEPPEVIEGVLDTYRIPARGAPDNSTEIFIVDEDGMGRYLVRPPKLSNEESRVLEQLRTNLLDSVPLEASGDPREIVAEYVWQNVDDPGQEKVVKESRDKLVYYLLREFTGFWEVDPLLNDDDLEEISVSRFDKPARVLHRRFSEYMFIIRISFITIVCL